MRIYRIRDIASDNHQETDTFTGTLRDASIEARDRVEQMFRTDIQVDEMEVETSKEGILAIFAGSPIWNVVKSWSGTTRGGLKAFEA